MIFQESFINIEGRTALWNKYTCKESSNLIDGYFTFGSYTAELLQEAFDAANNKDKVYAHGNPRLDLISSKHRDFYEEEVKAIKILNKDFILYTDAHQLREVHVSPNEVDQMVPKSWLTDEEEGKKIIKEFDEYEVYNQKFSELSKKLLKDLSYYDSCHIIVRPHPINKDLYWHKLTEDMNGIKVSSELPFEPWLLACQMLMTDRCTTGVQALCAGKKAVSLELLERPKGMSSCFRDYVL